MNDCGASASYATRSELSNILLSSLSCLLSLSLGSLCLLLGNSLRSWCRCWSWRLRLDDGVILRDDGEGDRHDHLTV